tara:strand:+ start:2790 stop:4418 length:1629 start_codon:yes stop_codon:yes gene_type:complete
MPIFTAHTGSAALKAYFETGDVPTQAHFIDLIDSLAVFGGTLPLISGSAISTGSFGNLSVVGNVISSLTPSKNNTYDLGSGTFLWRNAFINHLTGSGTAGESHLTASVHIIPGQDDKFNLGSSTNEWKDLYIDGTAYIDSSSITNADFTTVSSHLIPAVDNLKDLGSLSKQWKDLYIDGIAYLDTISSSANNYTTIQTASVGYFSSSLIPGDDDKFDLGASGKEWKDLYVDGTAYIDTISITTLSTNHITASNIDFAGSASIEQSITVNGNTTFGNASTDLHTFTGNVTASGTISSSGTITGDKLIINSPSGIAATITTASFNYISSSLIPGNDNIQDLGSSTKEWKDLYIDGVAYIDSASITNTDITKVNSDLTPTVTNLKDLGTSALQWKDLYVEGKAYIDQLSGSGAAGDSALTASVHIVPGVDNTYSLGSSGLEWKDLFIDGTANIDAAVIGTLTATSVSSNLHPTTTNTYNLGTGSKRYTEVYTTSQSLSVSASLSAVKVENLPTLESQARLIGTGSLWLGGISGSSRSNYLMVFTG